VAIRIVCGVQTGDSLKGKIMGISWLWALCLVQCGAICLLIGFLVSSIRFHRQQHGSIEELNETVTHWKRLALGLDDDNAKLRSTAEEQRNENKSAKRALEFLDEMRRAIERFDDGQMPF